MDERTEDVLVLSLFGAGVVAGAVGGYFLVRRYFARGEVLFQGRTYPITGEDKVWMGRMVIGEAGRSGWENPSKLIDGAAVLWSVATRWVTRPEFQSWSFTRLMRAFSQPINPIWETAQSSGCQRRPSMCTSTHLSRRAQIRSTSWSALPPQVQDLVDRFIKGRVTNPVPGYNNFAAAGHISSSKLASSELPPMTVGGNTFIRDPGSLVGNVRIA